MAHIDMAGIEAPGIVGLFQFRPETARPLSELAEILLRGPSSLSRGERELIAAYVSKLNNCHFCTSSHAAFAALQLPQGMELVDEVREDPESAPISPLLKGLLRVAAAVQRGGRCVSEEDIAAARAAGASDLEIHDTVLIAAAFCMYNRYVDGLETFAPHAPEAYEESAQMIVTHGYLAALQGAPAG